MPAMAAAQQTGRQDAGEAARDGGDACSARERSGGVATGHLCMTNDRGFHFYCN